MMKHAASISFVEQVTVQDPCTLRLFQAAAPGQHPEDTPVDLFYTALEKPSKVTAGGHD